MAGSVISRLAYLTLAALFAQSEFTFKIRVLPRGSGGEGGEMSRDQDRNQKYAPPHQFNDPRGLGKSACAGTRRFLDLNQIRNSANQPRYLEVAYQWT
jgi:hypothetical protein